MIITDYLCQLSTKKIRFRFYKEVINKESGCVLSVSGLCGGSSAVSHACIISMCFVQRFLAACLFVCLWIILFILYPHPSPPLYFSSDKSVCQVPGPISVGAHGWKARVYQGLACSRG